MKTTHVLQILILGALAILFSIFFAPGGAVFGEGPLLTSASYSLGVTHPPGYPLYLQASRPFLLFPCGTLVVRHHFFSIFSGLISLYLFHHCCLLLFGSSGFWGTFFLLSSLSFSISMEQAEVYSFSLSIFLLLVYSFVYYHRIGDVRFLYVLFFFAGLSLGCHLTVVIFSLLSCVYLLMTESKESFSRVFVSIFFSVLGGSVLLYLPLRAGGLPLINWGKGDNFRSFLTLITAKEEAMPSFLETFSLDHFWNYLSDLVSKFSHEIHFTSLVVIVIGIVWSFRDDKIGKLVWCFLYFFFSVLTVLVFLYTSNESTFFFLPGIVILALSFEFGVMTIIDVFSSRLGRCRAFGRTVMTLFFVVLMFYNLYDSGTVTSLMRQRSVQHDLEFYGRGVLTDSGGEEGLVFTQRSNLYFLLLYMQICERIGEEKHLVFHHLLSYPWFLHYQYTGVLPIEQGLNLDEVASNSQEWIDPLGAALIFHYAREGSCSVLEPFFFNSTVKQLFPGLYLEPGGFVFNVSEEPCLDISSSCQYRLFMEMLSEGNISVLNSSFYRYLQSTQEQLFLERVKRCNEDVKSDSG